jgi:SAM-dependent methyltransferase
MRHKLKMNAKFGAARLKELLGAREEFCIRGAYKHRDKYVYFDDTSLKDEWQREVYIRAASLAKDEDLKTVYDIGCGSGFKLMKHFRDYDTVGFDVPETLQFLQKTYPGRVWKAVPFSDRSTQPADLVICADVIEHVPDPTELLDFIKSLAAKWVVLSTPDRDTMYPKYDPFHLGPPRNASHIREWSFNEFRKFVAQHLTVKEHVISNREQATQMIVARI